MPDYLYSLKGSYSPESWRHAVDLCKYSRSSEAPSQLVAVKKLKPNTSETAQFQQEAYILPKLKHRSELKTIPIGLGPKKVAEHTNKILEKVYHEL